MRPWIIIIAATALGGVIHHVTRDSAPSDAARGPAAASPNRAEGRRSAADRWAPARPGALPELPVVDRAPGADAGGAAPQPPSPGPSSEQVRDGLEAFFTTEPIDTAWNRGAADTLTQGVQAMLPRGSRLQRVECRGTLCRIETSHLDVDEFRTYARDAFLNEKRVSSSGFFASVLHAPPGGPMTAVAYLAREGKELPRLESMLAAP